MAKKSKTSPMENKMPIEPKPANNAHKMNYLKEVVKEYQQLQEKQMELAEEISKLQGEYKALRHDNTLAYVEAKIKAAQATLRKYAKDEDVQVAKAASESMAILSLVHSPQDQNFLNGAQKEYSILLDKKKDFITRGEKAKSDVRSYDTKIKDIQVQLDKIQAAGDKSNQPQSLIDTKKRELQFEQKELKGKMQIALQQVKQFQIAQETLEFKFDSLKNNINKLIKSNEPSTQSVAKSIKKGFEKLEKEFKTFFKKPASNLRTSLSFKKVGTSTDNSRSHSLKSVAKQRLAQDPPKERRPAPKRPRK